MKTKLCLLTLTVFLALPVFHARGETLDLYKQINRDSRAGKFGEALKKTEMLLTEKPDDLKLHLLKAKALLGLQQWASAMAEARLVLEKDANFSTAYAVLGQAYFGKGDYKQALRYFEEAEHAGVDFPRVYLDMAVIYAYGKDYESAIREAKKAVAKNPNSAEGYYALGRFYAETDRYQEAIPYLERALDLNPDDLKAMEFLALSYLQAGNKNRARDLAKEVLEDDPKSDMAAIVLKDNTK